MKKIYAFIFTLSLLFVGLGSVANAQMSVTIYEENFGTPSGNTNVNSYTGWSNTTVTYTGEGNVDVRTTSSSTTERYPEASGSGNVMINNASKKLTVSGINTDSYTDITLSFGLRKGANAEDGSSFVVEYSTDGSAFTPIAKESLPTGSGSTNWHYISTTGTIPSSSTLYLRFRSTSTTVEFRLDDLKLTGTLNVSTPVVTVEGITNDEIEFDVVPIGNENVTKTFTVNAVNLTDDISLAISGTDVDSFEVSPTSISKGTGTITDQTVTVTYKPSSTNVESVSGTLTLSSAGADDVVISLSGESILAVPTAIAPETSSITENSFIAQWNAVAGAENYLLDVYTKGNSVGSSELVINGGFETGDKTSWSGTGIANFTVETTNPQEGVYYVSRTETNNARLEQIVNVEVGKIYEFSFWYNNYAAENTNGLKNYTIQGTSGTDYIEGASPVKLDAVSSWTQYTTVFIATEASVSVSIRAYENVDIDNVSIREIPFIAIAGSPFAVTSTTHSITGLSAETDYYYTVKAVAGTGSIVSDESNEIKVTTAASSVNIEEQGINGTVVYKDGLNIVVKADDASAVSVYSVSGKLVYNKVSAGGIVTIPLSEGVYIVKVGNKATKVVL